jgi:shikimate kinase
MRIYLTGFMGSGKTTVGRQLAERLIVPFVDLDQEIERRAHLSVREVFEQQGEPAFRRLEADALGATLAYPDVVVATGGGTLAAPRNAELIRQAGMSVWLNPPFQTIVDRIGGLGKRDRPLFRDETQALALYRDRLASYRSADVTLDIAPGEAAEEVVGRIELRLKGGKCAT